MKFTSKKLTRLLNSSTRKQILESLNSKKQEELRIIKYSNEVFKKYCIDKTFPEIILLEATLNNGEVKQWLFETKHLMHLLKKGDNFGAIEAVRCWLVLWHEYDKDIKFFGTEELKETK